MNADVHSSGREITLRPAVQSDAPAIRAVFHAAVRVGWTYLGDLAAQPMFTPADWEQLVSDHQPRNALLVAVDETDGIVGYSAVHPEDGEMFLLFVHPAHGGRGIGRTLLDAAHDALSAAGCTEAYLFVHEQNERALAVYAAAGYRPDDSDRVSDFRGTRIRELRLVKQLQAAPRSSTASCGGVRVIVSTGGIHHVGFNVSDLQAAIDTWVGVYGAGPFYVNEHVAYDESTSSGTAVAWDHSAGFGQWGKVPVELQQTHELRPVELVRPFTAGGRNAVNHIGVTADDPAAESARLESLGFGLCMHARLGEVEFFWHDATEAFGYCIEVISAAPGLDAFFDTVESGARGWDGRDPVRGLG